MIEPNENSKFFINKYGVFYTGQILEEYVSNGGFTYYFCDVEVISFFRRKRRFKLGYNFYFRYRELGKKQIYSISCDELGKRFKIK